MDEPAVTRGGPAGRRLAVGSQDGVADRAAPARRMAGAAEAVGVLAAIEDSLVAAGRLTSLLADGPPAGRGAAEQPATSIDTAITVSVNRAARGRAGALTGTPRAGP
jgi:hypothetical protein